MSILSRVSLMFFVFTLGGLFSIGLSQTSNAPNRLPKVQRVVYQQATKLELIPGDVIRLVGFPKNTGANTIIASFSLGSNFRPKNHIGDNDEKEAENNDTRCQKRDSANDGLNVLLSEAGKPYQLSDFDAHISFPYRNDSIQELIVQSGHDSVSMLWHLKKARTRENYFMPVIHDVGRATSSTALTTTGDIFIISQYPKAVFNVIGLRVESKDDKPLSGGFIKFGDAPIVLDGMSKNLLFKEQGKAILVFDISFPVPRKISVTWWVEDRTPAQKEVPKIVTETGASLQTVYQFTRDHMVQKDLSLIFSKNAFVDGKPPTITRLEHNPKGVRYPNRPDDDQGPTYTISGKLVAGKKVQVALPIPENAIIQGINPDSITIMHHNDATGVWTEVYPDSVIGGYAYFTTDSFSSWYARWKRKIANAAADAENAVRQAAIDAAIAAGQSAINAANAIRIAAIESMKLINNVSDAVKGAYNILVSGLCSLLDPATYLKLVIPDGPSWSVPQGDLRQVIQSPYFKSDSLSRRVWGQGNTHAGMQNLAVCISGGADGDAWELNERNCWDTSKQNAELLLADVMLSKTPNGQRRFKLINSGNPPISTIFGLTNQQIFDSVTGQAYSSDKIFRFSSEILNSTSLILATLQKCDDALGYSDEFTHLFGHIKDGALNLARVFTPNSTGNVSAACREVLHLPGDMLALGIQLSVLANPILCGAASVSLNEYFQQHYLSKYWKGDHRDDHIIKSSEFFNVFTTLLWADDGYKYSFWGRASNLGDEIHAYIGFTQDLYHQNNITIKAMAGVAFWDWISKGDLTSYNTMKSWLEAKTGSLGGYAEGTGYLQYINDDVPYVMAAMMRAFAISPSDLPPKYLESSNWLLNGSRFLPNGQILPAEVDDGVVKETDFLAYATLTGNRSLIRFHDLHPNTAPYLTPLRYLGLPSGTTSSPPPTLPDVHFADGVGTLRAHSGNDIMTLSIVAENGSMLTDGYGHDQQDNGSITLDHSRLGRIIVDPGYNGFGDRILDIFPRFNNHNVCMSAPNDESKFLGGEDENRKLTLNDILSAITKQQGTHNPDLLATLLLIFPPTIPSVDAYFGGAEARVSIPVIQNSSRLPSYGLEVKHTASISGVTNHRTVLSFGGYLWIIDRPEQPRSLWSQFNWWAILNSSGKQLPSAFPNEAVFFPVNPPSITQIKFLQNVGDPVLADVSIRIADSRYVQSQRSEIAPAFVTGYPLDSTSPKFSQYDCEVGGCFQRFTASAEEQLIVPQWNYTFGYVDILKKYSGQIVLAQRPLNSQTWTYRLVGEEGQGVRGWSLGSRTKNIGSDGFYMYIPTNPPESQMNVLLPNGQIEPLQEIPEGAP